MPLLLLGGSAAAQGWKDMAKQAMDQMARNPQATQLADSEIVQGLREALAKGTRSAVLQLGRTDGFWAQERFRIPLPKTLTQASSLLRAGGYGTQLDELHLSFNRAAEQAVPVAADVFSQAVSRLSIDDTLAVQFKPLVAKVTAKAGLVQQYDKVMATAGPFAAMAGAKADVNDYVARKALDGLFLRVAEEEKSIRQNPAARTSAILKKVFGSKT
jgi:hypothetical protein